MRIKYLHFYILLISLNFIPFSTLRPWGDKGHHIIAAKAFDCLPKEMASFKKFQEYITLHATDPDHRKRDAQGEAPKHFLDIDYYKEFLSGHMIENLDTLKVIYGDSIVTKEGILPWATMNTLSELTDAFKVKNKEKILFYASDLAHYVADGFQPQHATVNYDGKLTNQKGIHSRYESVMVGAYENRIVESILPAEAFYVKDAKKCIFDYISASYLYLGVIMEADNLAMKVNSGDLKDPNNEYYKILWFRTQFLTINQFASASRTLASLYYTAWINAGKPNLEDTVQ